MVCYAVSNRFARGYHAKRRFPIRKHPLVATPVSRTPVPKHAYFRRADSTESSFLGRSFAPIGAQAPFFLARELCCVRVRPLMLRLLGSRCSIEPW
jgi:hypothetical protein